MRKLSILFLLTAYSAAGSAASAPIVGIWTWKPVVEADYSAVVRTSYIFTEQALAERTVFSVLHDNTDGYSVICCLEVSNLKAVNRKALTSKYKHDPDFVHQLDSINGAPFMYEAHPIARKDLSPWLAALTADDRHPSDTSPFHAPAISGVFGKKDTPPRFELGGTSIKLKNIIDRKNERMMYHFSIGKRVVRLSEHIDLGD
jgi:hypothetical protein